MRVKNVDFEMREESTSEDMPDLVTLGDLASVYPAEKLPFKAIVASLDKNYPDDWRDWRVYNYSFHDLFGDNQVPPAVDVKLRFAIPTVDMALAFDPTTKTLSERSYRAIRSTIMKWPLGRALLYSPHKIMEKLHGPSYSLFVNTVAALKPRLLKRSEAAIEIGDQLEGKKRSIEVQAEAHPSPKRVAVSSTSNIERSQHPVQGSGEHLLASVLNQQATFFSLMLKMQSERNEIIKILLQQRSVSPDRAATPHMAEQDLNSSFESQPDSTMSEEACSSKQSKEADLRVKIADAQRKLAEMQESDDPDTEPTFDFMPSTIAQEPKVAKADSTALEHEG